MTDASVPAMYDVEVVHRRRGPVAHVVRHRMTTWLVDLDDVPVLTGWRGRLCRFDPADHVDVLAFLAGHGLRPARILMLAQPRVYGYVFNPLTVFYCLDTNGFPTHVVAEVRNTHGGLHCYVMPVDELTTAKVFPVSPYLPVDGEYTLRLPLPDDRLVVTVTLHRVGEPPFVATMTGVRREGATLADALLRPVETRAVMAGIRRHGITLLLLKGLRPHPGPTRSDDDQHPLDVHGR